MVDNKRLEYLESMYQDKCCITQMDKDIQSIIKELRMYRSNCEPIDVVVAKIATERAKEGVK